MFRLNNLACVFIFQVYFADLKYMYIESSPAYTSLALLCDVGGALGLFLGSTLLTFVELIHVAATYIVRHINKRSN
jgi:Amiloride-sensitive sodium channel